MFFSNMLGASAVTTMKRKGTKAKVASTFINSYSDVVSGGIAVVEDNLVVTESQEEAQKYFGDVWVSGTEEDAVEAEQLKDTPENPLIWCLTDEVTLLENTKTYFKFIPVDSDKFLFCLVKGVCEISSGKVPLIRNITPVEERSTSRTFKCDELCNLSSATDGETGLRIPRDAVSAMIITLKNSNMSSKTVRQCNYILTRETAVAYKEKQEAIKRERERKRAEEAEVRRAAEKRAKEMEAEKARKEDVASKEIKVKKPAVHGHDQGASAFLQFVANKGANN